MPLAVTVALQPGSETSQGRSSQRVHYYGLPDLVLSSSLIVDIFVWVDWQFHVLPLSLLSFFLFETDLPSSPAALRSSHLLQETLLRLPHRRALFSAIEVCHSTRGRG